MTCLGIKDNDTFTTTYEVRKPWTVVMLAKQHNGGVNIDFIEFTTKVLADKAATTLRHGGDILVYVVQTEEA